MSTGLDYSTLNIKEDEVTKMIIEFLNNRDLSISQMSIERETGVHNGSYSDDIVFLRQLILDGQWDDVIMFIKPLEAIEDFDTTKVRYLIYKHKYLEMLCLQAEASYHDPEAAVTELVNCMNSLEKHCASKEEYNELCLLLTLPTLQHDPKYKQWNPASSRVQCFNAILKLVEKFMPAESGKAPRSAKVDRLMRLIVKGLLYEVAIDYCQQQASTNGSLNFPPLLDDPVAGCSSATSIDCSLLSWLQAIPTETFSYPFKQRAVRIEFERSEKPVLSANWSTMILMAPLKPNVFPHSATPFTPVKGADISGMSKSLTVEAISRQMNATAIAEESNNMSRSSMPATTSSFSQIAMRSNQLQNQQQLLQLNNRKTGMHIALDRSFCFDSLPTIAEREMKTPDSNHSGAHSNQMSPLVEQLPPNHRFANNQNARRNSPPELYKQQQQDRNQPPAEAPPSTAQPVKRSNGAPTADLLSTSDMIKSQECPMTMSGLYREFQKQKRILARLIGDEDEFLSSCHPSTGPLFPVHSLNYEQANTHKNTPDAGNHYHSLAHYPQDYVTPPNQGSTEAKPNTSTPKQAHQRRQQSGPFAQQQPQAFDATCSSINSPCNQRNNDFSITFLGRPRETRKPVN